MTEHGNVGSVGVLTASVWPVYAGLGESSDNHTIRENPPGLEYKRGQIHWQTNPDGTITGVARVWVPKGIYTHIIFATGPVDMVIGLNKTEHPIVFNRAGYVDIEPIHNQDVLPR